MHRYSSIGVILNEADFEEAQLKEFELGIAALLAQETWEKRQLVDLFTAILPDFAHRELGKFLDQKM